MTSMFRFTRLCLALTLTLTALPSLVSKTTAAALPDLSISNITTVGGLCAGAKNKISVNIWNGSLTPVTGSFTVRLAISDASVEGAQLYYATISSVGGQGGQTAWFKDVSAPSPKALIQVFVDSKKQILEANETNNLKSVWRNVGAPCAP